MNSLLAIAILAAAQAQASWSDLGGSTNPGVSGAGTAALRGVLAVDHHDRPLVAWWDASSGNGDVYLRRWDGVSAWPGVGSSADAGGLSANAGGSVWPAIAVDSNDNPIVVWSDSTPGTTCILLRRWTGTDWDPTVQLNTTTSGTSFPTVAVNPAGTIFVAWGESISGNYEIIVRSWNGSAWTGVGGSAASEVASGTTGSSTRPQLAFDPDGKPVVSWLEGGSVFLKRWTGSQWSEVAGSATLYGVSPGEVQGVDQSTNPRLKVDSTGTIYVAWRAVVVDTNNNLNNYFAVHLKRWVPGAASWTDLGGSSTNEGASTGVSAADSVAGFGFGLAVDSANRPMVAYAVGGSHAVILRRWNGSAWADLGGSTTGTGVAGDVTSTTFAQVAVDSWDRPVVSWMDTSTGTAQVYLSRYNPPPTPPVAPTQLKQLALNGVTPIPNGATVDRQGLKVSAFLDDVNGDSIALQVEFQPQGTPFSGGGPTTFTGAQGPAHGTATLTVVGLPDETVWQWRVRAIDGGGLASPWVVSPDVFSTPFNGAPYAASIEQVQVWDRGVVSTLIVRALLSDPDAGDQVKLEIEVRRIEEPFTGTPTQQGDYVPGGTTIELTLHNMQDGLYKWRYETRDSLGKTSGWINYGNNPDSEADFSFPPFGSSGNSKCSGSAAGSAFLVTVLAAAAFSPRRR